MALLAQALDGVLHVAIGGQRAFREKVVVDHAEAQKVVADVGQAPVQAGIEHDPVVGRAEQLAGARDQGVDVQFLVAALRFIGGQAVGDVQRAEAQPVAFLGAQAARDFRDVLALVAVVRKAHVHAAEFVVTQPHAHRQDVHLPASVIDVVLALHLVPGRFQQVGDRRAVGRAAAVADMERAVRIGRHELHRHRVARPWRLPAILRALLEHAAHRCQAAGLRNLEIDKARAGDLDPGNMLGLTEIRDQCFGQFPGLHACGLGQQEGDIGRIVAVLARLGPLDHVIGGRQVLGNPVLATQIQQGLGNQFAQMLFHGALFLGTSRIL